MIEIREVAADRLAEHARIPIAFEVSRVYDVVDGALVARDVAPYTKDYDAIPGNHPTDWRFDAPVVLLWAFADDRHVGGALVVLGEVAQLHDLRVAPDVRGRGVGAALFDAALQRAGTLEVETQNVNVPACEFYAAMGGTLASVDEDAYPQLPGEVRLVWRL